MFSLQDNFFAFQKKQIGEHEMVTHPVGWFAGAAGQQLLRVIVEASAHYLDSIDYGRRYGSKRVPFQNGTRTPAIHGDDFHVWASVHTHCSSHPMHVHPGASLSGVLCATAGLDSSTPGLHHLLLCFPCSPRRIETRRRRPLDSLRNR